MQECTVSSCGVPYCAVLCCADLSPLAPSPALSCACCCACCCCAAAVFVRFLGRCTGRAGLPQMADTFVTDPTTHFNIGQVCSGVSLCFPDQGVTGTLQVPLLLLPVQQ